MVFIFVTLSILIMMIDYSWMPFFIGAFLGPPGLVPGAFCLVPLAFILDYVNEGDNNFHNEFNNDFNDVLDNDFDNDFNNDCKHEINNDFNKDFKNDFNNDYILFCFCPYTKPRFCVLGSGPVGQELWC